MVADKIKTNSFEETLAEPESLTTYYYTVSAEFAGVATAATASNRVTLGTIRPPYMQDFDDSKAIETFTTIDGDNDGRNWSANSNAARSRYNSKGDTDNWLITPVCGSKRACSIPFRSIINRTRPNIALQWKFTSARLRLPRA